MKDLDFDSILFYGLLVVFAVTYLVMFPQGWLISDEYTYVNQALAISEGGKYLSFVDPISGQEIPYKFTPYTLGNSFWLAIWIKLFGLKYIYVGSLFSIVAGSWLLYRAVKSIGYFVPALGLLFVYPSLAFFSSSTMSAVPSFMISCLFVFFMFTRGESKWKWFWLCVLASFSFWIRETNIVLLGGICLFHFLGDRRWFGYYFLGAIVGMILRLLSSYYYYDDPFYYLLAESFSLSYISSNIAIYTILIVACMPFGVLFLALYNGQYRWPIVLSSFIFLGLYLSYSFNASTYSGFNKGVILMGRFLIPLLPFFVLSVAWYVRNLKIRTSLIVVWFTVTAIVLVGMKYKVSQEGALHKDISAYAYDTHSDDHVFFDLSRRTNILRYLNPIHGDFAAQSDVTRLLDREYMAEAFAQNRELYIIQTINTANEKKSRLTGEVQDIIDQASSIYTISIEKELTIKPGLKLQILKIDQKDD